MFTFIELDLWTVIERECDFANEYCDVIRIDERFGFMWDGWVWCYRTTFSCSSHKSSVSFYYRSKAIFR
jgi:hypothetical protein